jgi:hypothetical protein
MVKFAQLFTDYRLQRWLCLMELHSTHILENSPSTRKTFFLVTSHCLGSLYFPRGEYGMGTMANELSLGCDCLGQIHYLVCLDLLASEQRLIKLLFFFQPGSYVAHNGSAVVIKNVICIHEEDAGVLWKHTDYRPGGRSQTVRRRRLVVSMVCTLANYGTESPHLIRQNR